jgi:hypothetical protein
MFDWARAACRGSRSPYAPIFRLPSSLTETALRRTGSIRPQRLGVVRLFLRGKHRPFEADDTHRFDIQWQSQTGAPVTLRRGALNLLFERGTQGCP